MKPGEAGRSRRDGVGLPLHHMVEPLAHFAVAVDLARQLDVERVVTGFGGQQPAIQGLKRRVVEDVRQQREPLAAASLDRRTAEQQIQEPAGLARPRHLMQTAGVWRRTLPGEADAKPGELAEHRLEVAQLFTRELREWRLEVGVLRIAKQQVHRGARRLLLAMGMVEQDLREVFPGPTAPVGICRERKPQHVPILLLSRHGSSAASGTFARVIDRGLTHVALPVLEMDRSLAFYAKYAELQVVHERCDDGVRVAWISDRTRPFVIVLIEVPEVRNPLLPLAHLGVGVESRERVDQIVAEAEAEGCACYGPIDSGYPVGYWALVSDPDNHTLEVSYGQEVGLAVEAAGSGDAASPDRPPAEHTEKP